MGEAAPKDNSMEEILASIRKIIGTGEEPGDKSQTPAKSASAKGAGDAMAAPAASNAVPPPSARPAAAPDAAPGSLVAIAAGLRTEASPAAASGPAPQTAASEAKPAAQPVSGSHNGSPVLDAAPSKGAANSALSDLAKRLRGTTDKPPSPPAPDGKVAEPAAPSNSEMSGALSEKATVPPAVNSEASMPPAASGTAASAPVAERRSAEVPTGPAPDSRANAASAAPEDPERFREALVSPSTMFGVNASFDRLRKSVLESQEARIEAMLRPMLKEWLDDNLPAMVERMVQAEIDRIVGEFRQDATQSRSTA